MVATKVGALNILVSILADGIQIIYISLLYIGLNILLGIELAL